MSIPRIRAGTLTKCTWEPSMTDQTRRDAGSAHPDAAGAAATGPQGHPDRHHRRRHAGGAGDPRSHGLHVHRRDAGDHRVVHDPHSTAVVRPPGVVATSGRGRRLGDGGGAGRWIGRARHGAVLRLHRARRDGGADGRRPVDHRPARRTRVPRRLHVAHGAHRLPHRRRNPGRMRADRRNARDLHRGAASRSTGGPSTTRSANCGAHSRTSAT